MQQEYPIRRVLISVYDKTGIIKFSTNLHHKGIQIISTTGTASLLKKAGLPIIEISNYINFPEIMDGRIKTLHPKIYGGILARRNIDDEIMKTLNIKPIDMVVINLYPFNTTKEKKNPLQEKIIENIDIGGPSMIRAAAKNYQRVAIVIHNYDYIPIISEMNKNNNALTINTKFQLASKAFEHIATYDKKIADYFKNKKFIKQKKYPIHNLPKSFNIMEEQFIKTKNVRYGENQHQRAAFYINTKISNKLSINKLKKIQGKDLSYNNIVDIDTALECIQMFRKPTCIILKHSNPCGVASAQTIHSAYTKAYQTDPVSAFGGVIALNKPLDFHTAKTIIQQQFTEIIIAPHINTNTLNILKTKKNLRIISYGNNFIAPPNINLKLLHGGGLLIQEHDAKKINIKKINIVTKRRPNNKEMKDALFCWKIIKFVKSNAIVYARNYQTIGIGSGQMSRIFATKIAAIKAKDAGLKIHGATMASDAFFPFCDNIEIAAKIGIRCIIQPGGSIKDGEIIDAANKHNIAMIFTHVRHFKH
ncbi:bifunctional phosphoribosylaminoimidazolecarboxamide formyltransferase/IMP cyclohydrolase [Blochmannia endosymbiont of Camponotus (Colobopsis) obliquus]|uniref:bifunctional phosphoribosylaminoimidazolecarboxamide formyltransferase/IMP cyclohydrolase n=1 Tax=Blochmannia endosymbiont of Camponotus (Colobopsis) obliquus TaxID=1505597 RepID=UPI00061A8AE9|nr:bifunctional phosphoribosylaminoimidazolecarboxamide formyltransferase/IMP cyclohydrolase [Blochmannia endosymbiont of Camponotus (Colobopsis) obliquus]AKC60699.1 Bifunctional purine biosynthesis protein PurH [Blochmannia endosymbiont of Camponotus (Colobopsis) obliquus]